MNEAVNKLKIMIRANFPDDAIMEDTILND